MIDVEIFAVGKWNGITFTVKDLQQIADTFTALKEVHKVPLKFGHNDAQTMTDGYPALGWVDQVWVVGSKLMGKFVDVPDIVMKAISKKMYRKVSIELDIGVKHKGTDYQYVLSGVALLGADLPAVSTLADLNAYLGDSSLAASRYTDDVRLAYTSRMAFTAIDGQVTINEGLNMSISLEDVKKLIADSNKSKDEQLTKMQDEMKKFTAEKTALEAMLKEKTDAEKSSKIKLARDSIANILEQAVKAQTILPAQREQFSKLLRIDNDEAVLSIDIKEVEKFASVGNKMDFNKQQGKNESDKRVKQDAGEEVTRFAKLEQDKVKGMSFMRAMEVVMERDPELAAEYLGGINE